VLVQQHVYKEKVFHFFEPSRAHMYSKLRKNANKIKKKIFSQIQVGYNKTQDFTLISNPLKKYKKFTKKSY
jgi:phosphopantetheine adenylyltransferase